LPDIHSALGAGPPAGTSQLTLFIPSVDRHHKPIKQEYWRQQALEALGLLFRGATAFPPGRGVWRDDKTGDLVFDDTVMVTSYVPNDQLSDSTLERLRRFLHRMGREANQGEIGIVIDSRYYGITDYDSPEHDHDHQEE